LSEKDCEIDKNLLTMEEKIANLDSQITGKSRELEVLNNELVSFKNAEKPIAKESIIIEKKIEDLNAECFEYENTRRYLHDVVQDLTGNTRVCCKVRPKTPAEKDVPLTKIK